MISGSLRRLGVAAAGVTTLRLPNHCLAEDKRKQNSQLRTVNFALESHFHGKSRVRVMKVRHERGSRHSVSEYTVEARMFNDEYSKCFTHEDNTDVIATDTQKNNVYVVAKRTPCSSPEQFGVDIARHFLNEYPMLQGVEVTVEEHPWQRANIQGSNHVHGFVHAPAAHAVANVKMLRNQRGAPEVTSGIRGMKVLKTTMAGWNDFLTDRYATLPGTDERCVSTVVTTDWTYVPRHGGAEPDYAAVRKSVEEQLSLGFFGPAEKGVYSTSVQATVYDMSCMVLHKTPDVANITISTPNIHYLPAAMLDKLGDKFENDIFVPTSDPSGLIQCTVSRDGDPAASQVAKSTSPDIDVIKSDIRSALINIKSNACPMAMRVAWHASGTWDSSSGTGGSDGATMRFEPEFSDAANAGLTMMIDMLKPVKDKHPNLSVADIWALAGATGIELLGGPKIPFAFGRTDATGSGRSCPAMAIPENGRLPDALQGAQHLRAVFGRQGFSDRDIVALSGGHTLGRCHKVRSGFDGPWTHNPLKFDNSYFANLMNLEWRKRDWNGKEQYEDIATQRLAMLPTDIALKTDPAFSRIAREYADDQDLFFKDFAIAFSKLLHNGCANKPPELRHGEQQKLTPCQSRSSVSPPKNMTKEQAGREFREYAMHGSTERMLPYRHVANVHEQEASSGRTALHKAAFWGHLETISYLLDDCRLDPNVPDEVGDTALHDAVRFGHTPLVHKLLASGADKKITNKDGKDAEGLAAEYGKRAILSILAQYK